MNTNFPAGGEPIVLAYSGGLDTSFLVPWLAEHYQRPIITVTVNTGGIDAAAAATLQSRALALGAAAHHLIDAAKVDPGEVATNKPVSGRVLLLPHSPRVARF